MVGFLTLLSFVAALAGGGWFWLGFVIMLGVWGNKLAEEQKAKSQIPLPSTFDIIDPLGPPSTEPIKLNPLMRTYPLPGDGNPVDLIDTTFPTPSPADIETTPPIPPKRLPRDAPASLGRDRTDINTADFDSILALPGIGAADAKLLIQHRDSYGPLSSMDELVTVLSLKPHIVERLRPLVTFSLVTSKPPEPPKSPPTSPTRPGDNGINWDDPSPPKSPRTIPPTRESTPTPPKSTGPVRAPIDF